MGHGECKSQAWGFPIPEFNPDYYLIHMGNFHSRLIFLSPRWVDLQGLKWESSVHGSFNRQTDLRRNQRSRDLTLSFIRSGQEAS